MIETILVITIIIGIIDILHTRKAIRKNKSDADRFCNRFNNDMKVLKDIQSKQY